MLETLSNKLTAQFYEWELRGRGWSLFNVPVELEPNFIPFFFHELPRNAIIDDGKRPTVLSTVADSIKNLFSAKKIVREDPVLEEELIEAYPFVSGAPLHFIKAALSKGYKVPGYEAEQFLLTLASCEWPVSFEIVATSDKITLQFACRYPDEFHLKNQLKSYFPGCVITDQQDTLTRLLIEEMQVLDFGLSEEFMRPLAMPNTFDPDPYLSLFGVLDNIQAGQAAAVQILFKNAINPWAESILRSVMSNDGDSFFEDAPELAPFAKQKISAPFYATTIRVIGSAKYSAETDQITRTLAQSLILFSRNTGNKLTLLSNEGYDDIEHLEDVFLRQTHRLGMLLNSKELACFIHFPSASIISAKLERDTKKTKAAPSIAQGHNLILGTNEYQGKHVTVTLSNAQRLKHTHIIGATGTGKSTLLVKMILQDIEQNNAVAVLDPHGDLIDKILAHIPETRVNDVLIIDPADAEYPVGLNILSAHSEIEKDILSSDLVAAFRRYSTAWGDQMNSVFANAILAFLDSSHGGTLAELRRFLIEKNYRDSFLKTVSDPSIVYYWKKEYPLLKTGSLGSILTRLDSFLRPKLIRNMVSQKKSIDFRHLMDTQKIILIKLSQGLIGEENSYLLGTFIVSKLHQAAMSRQARSERERNNFFFYIDEFQHFGTPSMASLLSGARKYHLGLVLAHQDMHQLQRYESELTSAIIANAGTRICFRLGDADAKKLEDGFSFFDSKDLQNLAIGEAIMRIDNPENDFSLKTDQLLESDIPGYVREAIIEQSRQTYSTPKGEVEELLMKTMQMDEDEIKPKAKQKTEEKEIVEEKPIEEAESFEPTQAIISPPLKQKQDPGSVKPIDLSESEKFIKKQEERRHTTLKNEIKLMAQARGFTATQEAPVNNAKGFVDVMLERNGLRIACEVSITTSSEWEMHNITKCLTAGFDNIIVCSPYQISIEKLNTAVRQQFTEEDRRKILLFQPEALYEYLNELVAKDSTTEETIRGRKVRRELRPLPPEDAKHKTQAVRKIVKDSKTKKKPK